MSGPGGLWILSPSGEHLGTVSGPEHPHNMAWGDDDRRTLYLAAQTGLYRIRVKVPGATTGSTSTEPVPASRIQPGMKENTNAPERIRIQGEYRETPGLKLSAAQASRFWHLGLDESRELLDSLVEQGSLARTRDGFYVLARGVPPELSEPAEQ